MGTGTLAMLSKIRRCGSAQRDFKVVTQAISDGSGQRLSLDVGVDVVDVDVDVDTISWDLRTLHVEGWVQESPYVSALGSKRGAGISRY